MFNYFACEIIKIETNNNTLNERNVWKLSTEI